jgi:hypothetical protein
MIFFGSGSGSDFEGVSAPDPDPALIFLLSVNQSPSGESCTEKSRFIPEITTINKVF